MFLSREVSKDTSRFCFWSWLKLGKEAGIKWRDMLFHCTDSLRKTFSQHVWFKIKLSLPPRRTISSEGQSTALNPLHFLSGPLLDPLFGPLFGPLLGPLLGPLSALLSAPLS